MRFSWHGSPYDANEVGVLIFIAKSFRVSRTNEKWRICDWLFMKIKFRKIYAHAHKNPSKMILYFFTSFFFLLSQWKKKTTCIACWFDFSVKTWLTHRSFFHKIFIFNFTIISTSNTHSHAYEKSHIIFVTLIWCIHFNYINIFSKSHSKQNLRKKKIQNKN